MDLQQRFAALGRGIYDHHWWVIAAWILAVCLLRVFSPEWSSVARDGDLEQLPSNTAIAQGEKLNSAAFPSDVSKSQFVLVVARHDGELTHDDREFAILLGNKIGEALGENFVDVWNEKTPAIGSSLRSKSDQAVRVVVRLTNEFMATQNIELLRRTKQIVEDASNITPTGLEIGITGSAAIGGDMLSAAAESVQNIHTTTIALVAAALLLIYRSPRLVLVPMLAIGVATTVSIDLLAILAAWSQHHPNAWPEVHVFTTTKIFVIVILFGSGTDYCLFLTARFREHRSAGLSLRDSLTGAMQHVGTALVASALTTIVGLAMMGFAEFGKFSYSGPTIAICLAVTLLACLTFVPGLLATRLGSGIERGSESDPDNYWQIFWGRLADAVLSRPRTVLAVSLLLAIPFAWIGWNVNVTYDLLGELPAERTSRHGTDMLKRYFPPGEIGPLVVLAELPSGNLDSVDGQLTIAELAKPLYDLPGVEKVRSLYQPLGDPPGSVSLFSSEGLLALAAKGSPLTQAVFVSQAPGLAGRVTRLFLILDAQPFSPEAVASCSAVERKLQEIASDNQSPWHDARFALAGPTVGIRDLEQVTLADRTRIQLLVTFAVLVVIILLLRKPMVCVFLIVTVVMSYLVTIGIIDLLFTMLRGEGYVGLDWKVPLFLFVLLVAVGQDYNIYLVSRVIEEQRGGELRAGLRRAVIQTGGIITSCGIIMAGTFVSMTTSELNGMIELGFALTLGILLDTFVVRTIVVPAFLGMLSTSR
ncbi:MMPL family transporter [Bythopirellula polymerisocia]|uniref:Putative membrane protein YdgH n=1 Tax=Bythopirellula polymerisocia TaxID=2528003 RepID=A0A5C6CZW9_9BACT|nr:MMPL family transporter [Bythopirellula polymerisocia]TWU29998.1 putative membrane protein YdgH [Bythopirellula polymerisocia]